MNCSMKREAPSQLGPIVMLNIRATPPFSAIFYFLCILLMATIVRILCNMTQPTLHKNYVQVIRCVKQVGSQNLYYNANELHLETYRYVVDQQVPKMNVKCMKQQVVVHVLNLYTVQNSTPSQITTSKIQVFVLVLKKSICTRQLI